MNEERTAVPVERGDTRAETRADTRSETTFSDAELLPRERLEDFRRRWEGVQGDFVDHPREAVKQAHDLLGELVDQLTASFAQQRQGLEGTWSRGEDVSTEDLRVALQRYRSFFNRLLSA